jgi:hypothetical protein
MRLSAIAPQRTARIVLALLTLGLAVYCPPAVAGNASGGVRVVDGVAFPTMYEGTGVTLRFHNAALLRYKIFFRGYVVGLYLPEGADPGTALEEIPKRLEFEYFWEIPGDAFGKAGEEILARNVDAATLSSLRDRLERIRRAYRDVKPGDRYALTYRPGTGTELSYNGAPLVVVEGDDFAAAYFSIWLGRNPIDERLKEELLRKG